MSLLRKIGAPVGLFLSSLAVHLTPFLYSAHPLGYDTGFYRRYLTEPLSSFPNAPVPGLGDDALVPRLILDTLHFFHLPTDIILYGTYLLFIALLPVFLFYFLRKHTGTIPALLASFLVIISPVQYAAFWFMLFKESWALLLILPAFVAIEKNMFLPALLLDLLIAGSHKTSAAIFIATLAVLAVISKEKRVPALLHAGVTGLALLAVALPDVRAAATALPVGIFMSVSEYVLLSLPLLILGAVGICTKQFRLLPQTLRALLLAALLFPLLQLPFYERVFPFLDLALIPLAALAAVYVMQKSLAAPLVPKIAGILFLAALAGAYAGGAVREAFSFAPLEDATSLAQIEEIGLALPAGATVLTTSDEAPFYEGWTHAHVAAPGMLHDWHDLSSWNDFWDSSDTAKKEKSLAEFPQPFFVSTLEDMSELVGTPPPCLVPVAPHLYTSECKSD